jgi:hypothetical protein
MSRSNPNAELTNPCQKWFKWKGKQGGLAYYNKETKEDVIVPLPFTFIYLDSLNSIKGFSEADNESIYSNEVRDLKSQPMTVKVGKTEFSKGLYADIKDKVKAKGGKYCQSTYIAFKEEGKLVIGNIAFTGGALAGGKHKIGKGKEATIIDIDGWMEFAKGKKAELESMAVTMDVEEKPCTKGDNVFYVPKFRFVKIGEETNNQAIELDKELQEFLTSYLSKKGETPQEPVVFTDEPMTRTPVSNEVEEDDDLPF